MKKKRSASSHQWLREHFTDPYVKEAQRLGYRSRAAFKLLELNERDHFIKPGMCIVDLGAAPGGWSQIAKQLLKGQGKIIALDILPMAPIEGVDFIQGDFHEESTLEQLVQLIGKQPIDLVMSDIAPNMTGIDGVDQPRAMLLVELAYDFARQHLKVGGDFLVKVFQGPGFDALLKAIKQDFMQVYLRKPKASRNRSAEIYLLARNKKIR